MRGLNLGSLVAPSKCIQIYSDFVVCFYGDLIKRMKQQATPANKVQGKKREGNLLDSFSCSKKLQQNEVITIHDDSRVMTPTATTAAKDVASRTTDDGGGTVEDVDDDEECDEDYVPVKEGDDDCCVIDLNECCKS